MTVTATPDAITQDRLQMALYGAFFTEGIFEHNYDAFISSWDQGCVELMREVTGYAPFLHSMVGAAETALGSDEGRPGVLEYEVCAPFGSFMAKHVLQYGSVPEQEVCQNLIRKLVTEFFSQCQSTEGIRRVQQALSAG